MSAGLAEGAMRAAVWNARAALLYSLGGWTMLGAVLHYNSNSGNGTGTSGGQLEDGSDLQANPGPRTEVYTRETALGFKVTTVVTYRETEAPLTRLLRRVVSFFVPSDSPPPEN